MMRRTPPVPYLGWAAVAAGLTLVVAPASPRIPATGARGSGAAVGSPASEGLPLAPQEEPRFDGEYGLWVQDDGDSLSVRWITSQRGPGSLTVMVKGKTVLDTVTAEAFAHAVSLERPGKGPVSLRYGSRSDPGDRHETTLYLPSPGRRARATFDGVDSLYVVGDVHGEYERLLRLLGNAGLTDGEGRWTGGRRHLVLLGDLFDRGPDVTRLLWWIYGLERQAEAAGGRVHVVLGNHEVMAMTDDLRYVSAKESLLARRHGTTYPRLFDARTSVLGKWLASRPGLVRIGPILLAHGGVGPDYLEYSVQAFNDSLYAFMHEPLFHYLSDSTVTVPPMDSLDLARRLDFFFEEGSVFWYRDYVQTDTLATLLEKVLDRHDSERHVVGHTPVARVEERYGGDLVAVDLEEAASELLLLVLGEKRGDGSGEEGGGRAFRIGLEGPPEPLDSGGTEPGAAGERGDGPGAAGEGRAGAGAAAGSRLRRSLTPPLEAAPPPVGTGPPPSAPGHGPGP